MEEPLEQTISARQLGAAFSGCFLGAGYVSGREMWQFFGRFGPVGWLGLCLSIALLGGAGLLLLTMVRRTGRHELSFLMVPWQCPALRHLLALFSVLLLFGVVMFCVSAAFFVTNQQWGSVRSVQGEINKEFTAETAKIDQLKLLETQKAEMVEKARV